MWIIAVHAVKSLVEKLLKPFVALTPNPVDDIGVDVILGVLDAWLAKKDDPKFKVDTHQ